MLWFRGARLFLKLTLAAVFAVFLGLNPGSVSLKWFGYQLEMPVAILLVCLFAFISICLVIHSMWRKIWQIPEQYLKFMQKRKTARGEKLLVDALTAIAAQQPDEAVHSIELAKVLIPNHPLISVVAAQSAHMGHDSVKAKSYFETMYKSPALRFLGLRGLILQAKEEKDWLQTETFLKEALKLRPDSPWVQEQILENQIQLVEVGQEQSIQTQGIRRFLKSDVSNTHQGITYWLKAQQSPDDVDAQLTSLNKAHGFMPDHSSIACSLALVLYNSQNLSKAQKVLRNTYKLKPHRDLATCWLKIHPDLKSLDAYQDLEKLTQPHSNHPETLWVMGQAAFEAQLWGQAHKYLQDLHAQYGDTQGVCYMMGQLEEVQHPQNQAVVRSWWRRAMAEASEAVWICEKCDHHSSQWQPICENCGTINKSNWQGFQKVLDKPLLIT
ncbi:heme biosynthesis HemY N-terminal domain-containing protein [Candidatus Finniella inopinata]|uniref:HemY N-terminal domain-containing protein n=1 Tax=Candidatus Finniella inopinata TaxID=1696036 RepID=A0A4Q7DKC6_9PROT|nr:heme biosynthesis HemY N-terminal domain-containing protein [Candidatus Finniella inopinata]RZI46524.1 hypothetical protein EQU50_02760 [Candidatus Finniella inopinata]